MRRHLAVLTATLLGATAATVALGAPANAASAEFGNRCATVEGANGYTTIYKSKGPSNPLPATAPQSGVITKVTITLPAAVPGTIPVDVKAMHPTGAPDQYTVAAQTPVLAVPGGVTGFDVRVPISSGDALGVSGDYGLYCETGDAADVLGAVTGDQAVGSTATYPTVTTEAAVPVVAKVEPDADHDGYGDETQDQCPQSASTQGACPVASIRTKASASGGKLTVKVTSDQPTTATVTGKVRVGGTTYKLKSKGAGKAVTPGSSTKVKVSLPRALKAALAGLPRTTTVTVRLKTTATNLAGAPTVDKSKVTLHGTGR